MVDSDRQLSESCAAVGRAVRDGISWFDTNASTLKQDTTGLVKELKRAAVAAAKLEQAALRKMCVGVFGPSQAGKSYMISALARRGTDRLIADFAGLEVDFIAEINPEGGKESTGVVTRFTVDRGAPPPIGHPVEVRLLTESDIVKILVNSYVSDITHEQEDETQHDASKILEAVEALGARAGAAPVGALTVDHMTEIEEYCNEKLIGNPRIKVLRRIGFWDRVAPLAPLLGIADRARLFALLWDGQEVFTTIYRRLYDALAAIDFAPTAYCSLDGLCRMVDGAAKRREDSIVNVETLAGLGDPSAPPGDVSVATQSKTAMFRRAELTALIAELRIVMRDKPYPFFDHTDLLDFPGARSRKAHEAQHLGEAGIREELFLRGKVAYLFERYCAEQELTSMLLCMGPENMEVVSLPGLVFEWVRATMGERPADREGRPNALFLVMTKFDTAFAQAAGKSTGVSRWATRLQTSLLKPFGAFPAWPLEWTPRRPFDNCLWIRNPNFRQDAIFDYESGTGLIETGVRPDKVDFIEELRKSFLEAEEVLRHFADPHEAWNAAMALNDGGISLVVKRLEPLCNPAVKRNQVDGRLKRLVENLRQRLQPFYFSGDLDAEQQKQDAMVQRIADRLSTAISAQLFGELLKSLQVVENDVYDIFLSSQRRSAAAADAGADGQRQAVRKGPIGATVERQAIVSAVFKRSPATTAAAPPKNGTARHDAAEVFVQAVEQYWTERIHELAREPMWLGYFDVDAADLVDVAQELVTGLRRSGTRDAMISAVRHGGQFKDTDKEALIWKQVLPAVGLLNRFVDWLGYGGPGHPEGTDISFDGDTRHIFGAPPPVGKFPVLPEEPPTFESDYAIDWLVGFRDLVRQNVAYRSGAEINVGENSRIGDILARLETAAAS
jgi:hypothetical protein